MPIKVEITVNDKVVDTVHIARVSSSGSRNPETVHTYSAVRSANQPQRDKDWDEGVMFTHKYGDGASVCAQKALEALATQSGS